MPSQRYFFVSIAFALIAWSVVASRYLWPRLRQLERADALRPILVLHSFRFEGLAFLVPGVVAGDLPSAFAQGAACGDFVTALLALLSLATLQHRAGIVIAWIFGLWGSADLVNAFYQANAGGLTPGHLGSAWFIPTLFVPLLLVTHVLAFGILLRERRATQLRVKLA